MRSRARSSTSFGGGGPRQVYVPRYYGSLDSTPLFLILLSELWRWTNDNRFVAELRGPALRALEWIDRYGDRDGDGFVEYLRCAPIGPMNQCWKDSDEAIVFADGTRARGGDRTGRGAGLRLRREAPHRRAVARGMAGPRARGPARARRCRLKERFNAAFWCERSGEGLRPCARRRETTRRLLCSNIGHLLWSGIVPDERASRSSTS